MTMVRFLGCAIYAQHRVHTTKWYDIPCCRLLPFAQEQVTVIFIHCSSQKTQLTVKKILQSLRSMRTVYLCMGISFVFAAGSSGIHLHLPLSFKKQIDLYPQGKIGRQCVLRQSRDKEISLLQLNAQEFILFYLFCQHNTVLRQVSSAQLSRQDRLVRDHGACVNTSCFA